MALSDDLRTRVVESVLSGGLSRNAAARRSRSASQARFAGSSNSRRRRDFAQSVRRRPSLQPHRSSSRLPHGLDPPHARHHAARNRGEADQELRRAFFEFRAVALLRASRRDAQKKSAHAAEQQRPDVLKRRLAWFAGQPDLDPRNSFSSTRPAPPPIWRAKADVAGGDEGCAPPSRMAIIRRSRSSPACV